MTSERSCGTCRFNKASGPSPCHDCAQSPRLPQWEPAGQTSVRPRRGLKLKTTAPLGVPVVGISGPAGCGKSTAAQAFVDAGYVRLPLAGPLKRMLREGLGLTEEHTDGVLKEAPIDWLDGITPRRLMQTIGTEWGRGLHDEFWLRAWRIAAESVSSEAAGIIVDDVRFLNEAAYLREHAGARIISLVTPAPPPLAGEAVTHASELDLWSIAATADAVVVNLKDNLPGFQARVLRAAA